MKTTRFVCILAILLSMLASPQWNMQATVNSGSVQNFNRGFSLGEDNSSNHFSDPGLQLSSAASLSLLWNTFAGGIGTEYGNGIAVDAEGNIYVVGSASETWGNPLHPYSGDHDIVVAKFNKNGVYQWHSFWGYDGYDYGEAVAVGSDGSIYVLGNSRGSWGTPLNPHSGWNMEIMVMKLNSQGVYQWHTYFGSTAADEAFSIKVDNAEGIIIAGLSHWTWGSPLHPHTNQTGDMVIIKINKEGALQWHTFYGSAGYDFATGIAIDEDNSLFIVGSSGQAWGTPIQAPSGNDDFTVLKLNTAGVYQWHTFAGSSADEWGYAISLDTAGNIYITGTSYGTWGTPIHPYNSGSDLVIVKFDKNGSYQWHTFYGSDQDDQGRAILTSNEGNIYIAGRAKGNWGSPPHPFQGLFNIVVIRLNSDGAYKWHNFFGSGWDYGEDIVKNSQGNLLITGRSVWSWGSPGNPHSGSEDILVMELSPMDYTISFPLVMK